MPDSHWQKDPLCAEKIERLAARVANPIERLQFLRRATDAAGRADAGLRWGRAAGFLLLAAVVSLRSDANVHHQFELGAAPPSWNGASLVPNVWIVDENRDFETYSNGLRIENRLAVANQPRSYSLIAREENTPDGPARAQPAGIVFHATESAQAPFEAGQRRRLQRIGKELLLYVRGKRAYHFVIDRFGRVNRIVVESDAANHAGNSVWADARWVYMDLNASFLGVAFEASTASDEPSLNEAQVHAARVLTEMLRSKYNFPAENCVTHAQVSVNPENMHIGWHADWGRNFPFREVGLPDNYAQPPSSMWLFGFEYDAVYRAVTGPPLWKGLETAEERIRQAAMEHGLTAGEYRALLRTRYRNRLASLRQKIAVEEN